MSRKAEDRLQIACVTWFDLQYPHLASALVHTPNGGKRTKVEAGIFKAMGVRAGFPDLTLFVKNSSYGALFIEMKNEEMIITPKQRKLVKKVGSVSPVQKEYISFLQQQGYMAVVVSNFETFQSTIEHYLSLP